MGCCCCSGGGMTEERREQDRLASLRARAKADAAKKRQEQQFDNSATGRAARIYHDKRKASKAKASQWPTRCNGNNFINKSNNELLELYSDAMLSVVKISYVSKLL